MKRVLSALLALSAVALANDPAEACTRDSNVRDFPINLPSSANNLVFGNVTVLGMDTIAACDFTSSAAGTLRFYANGLNPEFFASLPIDARFCMGGGDDSVRVHRSGDPATSCRFGNTVVSMRPLNYGGRRVIIVGMEGNDRLIGGNGVDVLDSFSGSSTGSPVDVSMGRNSGDTFHFSSRGRTTSWGGVGNDKYFASSLGGITIADDSVGAGEVYSGQNASIDSFCDRDQLFTSVFCSNAAVSSDRINLLLGGTGCNFPTDAACQAAGSPPFPQ